ncbi:hypothetical protein Atai01_67100 [Amycolatopsis taiwanensis]|uniref:Uncharacterized protein n=1 Tax=Amycolatopsis taiwanensis TaxID=342230 RepID=A0A9W6R613_9PSEU|nr:hypothetical protein Atai01_67100 [Amycolatopsis taiwanensis]
MILPVGTPAAKPTNADPTIRARNGFIFSHTISATMIAIPMTVTAMSRVSCEFQVAAAKTDVVMVWLPPCSRLPHAGPAS